ncbi:hypothetical protein ACIPYV_21225, partial [Paenarthrobacter nicotinovorans]|uniref:hypothetical protein n=1 Tax=Paenarthrobacter nicotinovorans TaxID=29320 RepID=UPI00382DCB61
MAANTSVAVPSDTSTLGTPVEGFFAPSAPQEATAPAGALENYANNVVQPLPKRLSPGDSARIQRWEARQILWHESSLKRCRTCGRFAVTADGSVQVRANGQAVGYAGLASCGSVHSCPVCNAKIQAVRRLELMAVLAWALDRGSVLFGTHTLRHHAGMRLDPLWRGLGSSWRGVSQDKTVRKIREAFGLDAYTRAAEVTHTSNGWHPHLHLTRMATRSLSQDDVSELHAAEVSAWIRIAERHGFEARAAAQDLHLVTGDNAERELGRYMAKTEYRPTAEAVAWESTSTQTKSRSRGEGRTPWQILDDFRLTGDLDDLDLWHQWERDSKGKRALTWSRGLRDMAGLGTEATDEEIAESEVGSAADAGFTIVDWAPIRQRPALGAQLLNSINGGR